MGRKFKYASVCSGVEAATLAWQSLGWEAAWFSEIEPFPCEVLRQRFPNVPNLGDMTKIKVENIENGNQKFTGENGTNVVVSGGVDLLVGGTPCFVEDTLVLTPCGYRKIQDLKVGDEVVSHLGNVCKVTATGNKEAEVGTVKIQGREKIICTSNHPFYVCDDETDYDFEEIKSSVGKFAGMICLDTQFVDYNMLETLLAGWFLGCGRVENGKIILSMLSKRAKDFFLKTLKKEILCTVCNDEIHIENDETNKWIIDNFMCDNEMCVPYFVYNDSIKELFVDAYLISTTQIENNSPNIYYNSESLALSFADLIGNHSVKKDRKTNKWYSYENKKTKIIEDRFASRIKEFKENGTIRTVYNITVEHDHTYIVNGIAVHNCQGFSLAGKQKGLDDERSVLALTYIRLLEEMRPRWFVWENVPGVLATNGGNDFKEFIGKITEIGYSSSWRIIDSQYCRVDSFPRAVPQRRRRLFVVGHLGDEWQYSAQVLFEQKSVYGNNPPKRVKGKGFTACS